MKTLFVILVMISASAFAVDFNKVTGTFDTKPEKVESSKDTLASAGTFDPDQNDSRKPASSEKDAPNSHVNEMTGSFK